MHKRRIIFSNYDDVKNPYYGGGGALAIHEVAKRLAKKFQVVVITGNYPRALKNEVIDGVKYRRIGPSFVGPKLSQLLFHFLLPWQVMVKQFDSWIENFTPPFSTSFLPLFTVKPVIGSVHMLSGEDMRRKYFFPFDWIEIIGLKAYKYCITTSEFFREKIIAINRDVQVSVIPNGVDLNAFDHKGKTAEYILFLGRVEVNQKGLDLLLEAYGIIRDKVTVPLAIAGSGTKKEMQKLRQLIRELKLEGKVKLLGRVEGNAAKRQLFQKAVFCVIPSRFETFSMVALESMAAGTPVVAFNVNGLRWIPGGSIVKIPLLDIASLAQSMLDLSNNMPKRDELAQNGRTYAKQYDWDIIAKQYEALIAGLQKQ